MENKARSVIRKGLEQLRSKLLDITGNNPLISFRHLDRSKGQIQAIHTPMEAIYTALREENNILFKALPEPNLLEKFQLESILTPKEHAISLGINPSCDLQLNCSKPSEELAIQTLLFPDKFLKKMTGFLDVQKQYIEETGVNCMHACFGFLEWYESPSSKNPKISPLLMVPIHVEREYKRQQSIFQLCSSGEETRDNPALAERLKKDFGIQLPILTETTTLQDYFSELKMIIKDQPQWKILQRITIGRVSFSKILMYYDLNPTNWPEDDPIFDQPLVQDLFVGSDLPLSEGFALDDHLDETDQTSPVPLIISDLDSSQLSSVADAMNHKNFVIEGPPGTGKSQTITNIIAAAMAEGKSVLFVAEKLVALQVVKNRLDAAGLGQFCLELHGTKVQKCKFYENLKTRLELKGGINNKLSRKLDLMITDHKEMKHKLNLYASTMGMCFGISDRTFHEYFWLYQIRKNELPMDFVEKIESLSLKNASQLSENELIKFKETAEQWFFCNQEMQKEFSIIKKHPWFGFQSKFDENHQIKTILNHIDLLKSDLIDLKTNATWFESNISGQEVNSFSDLIKLTNQLQTLLDCLCDPLTFDLQVFIRITSQNDINFLTNFCQQQRHIQTLTEDLKKFVQISDFPTLTELQELINHLSELWSGCELDELQEWTASQIKMILHAKQLKELPIDFPIQEFAKSLHAINENQQKWQACERECRTHISTSQDLDYDFLNQLKDLQKLSKEGGFEDLLHGKWQGLHKAICEILQNPTNTPSSNFDGMMLNLPQDLIEQKKILGELNHFIKLENVFLSEFSQKFIAFLDLIRTIKNNNLTLSNLNFFRSEKAVLSHRRITYKKVYQNIIKYIAPNWAGSLSIKIIKVISEIYIHVENTSRNVLRLRTSEICNEINHNDLEEAILKYKLLQQKRSKIECQLNLDIDSNLIRQSISALKHAGIFSWFKKETREAKRIFRENSNSNINCTSNEMLLLFEQLQSFKNEYTLFIEEPRFNIFLNVLGKIGESRLEDLVDLINWSAKINQSLRGHEPLLADFKKFIFDSDLSQIDSFILLFENIDLKVCLDDIAALNPTSLIDDQIDILNKEVDDLDRLQIIALEVGYQPDILFEKAEDAYKIYCGSIEIQKQITGNTQRLYNQTKILESAIDIYKEIDLKTLPESLSILEFINLVEQCNFWKEQTKKQEALLLAKKFQIQHFFEKYHTEFLNQDVSFCTINKILEKLQSLRLAVTSLGYSDIFSPHCEMSDKNSLDRISGAFQLYLNLTNKGISQPLITYIQNENFEQRLLDVQTHLSQLQKILPHCLNELEYIIKSGEINTKIWFGKEIVHECPLVNIIDKFENVYIAREHLQGLVRLNILDDKLAQYGIKRLCTAILSQKIDSNLIPIAIEFVFYQSIITSIQEEHSILNQLDYQDLNSLRKRFAEIDQQLIGLYRELAAAKIMERIIDPGSKKGSRSEWTGKALIELEVSKKRKHRTIRGLLKNAGEAMQALKPCFMMSPLSVVQYLAPGELKFDLIIIDEASQVKPEDAIGTLARGKQIIIVGDPKQLPPTDFWKKETDFEEGEESEDIGNEESILDLASTIYQPMRRLRWHYRSQHESLISFSNKEFYDNNLIIFPSPNFGDSKLGLKYQFVENAQYLRGGDKINSEEATQLANAVEIFMRDHPDKSIGIITMNVQQRELIHEMMNARFAESTIVEDYRAKWHDTLEPFFVKNLENVQGDERDVIFISTVYGKEKNSPTEKLNQNFGPINKINGHRRLNVLFTRAKQKIVIFSSLDPDEIRITEESPRGLRVFKEYLKYAKTGNLSFNKITGRDYGSDFERAIAKHIENWGYEVDSQVGVGSYFLDLAVIHPHKPGKHMLAIECDGATYHSSRSARDRDRLRQQALERMGWSIHRIWSTDWFRSPRVELDRLKAILQLKATEP